MKLRSFYSVLAGVVVVLLLIAVAGWFWLLSQSPINLLKAGQDATPGAVMFVPRQAPAVVSLLVNPEQLESFRLAVAKPKDRRRARADVEELKQSLLGNTGLSYEQDIRPWLGEELTLAVSTLDIDRDPTNGKQPGYLLAIATKDPERSREFLQLFWQKRAIAGTDLVFEQYKGVKLIYGSKAEVALDQNSTTKGKSGSKQKSPLGKGRASQSSNPYAFIQSPSLASAAVGNRYILFASHPKVLRDAINNVQAPDLSLANADFYEQSISSLTQPRIGLSFINLPGLASWLAQETTVAGKEPGGSPSAKSLSPAYQTMTIALKLDKQGLLAETALTGNKKSGVQATLSQPVNALQYIPAGSALSASGINLDRLWSGLESDLKSYETVSQLVNQPLAELQKRWKIDLPKDVFSWVKGEYALSLMPDSTDDWVFVAQRSDSSSAKQGIDRLDAIAKEQGLSAGPLQLGDRTVFAWTQLTTGTGKKENAAPSLQANVKGVHTAIDNYEVFTSSIALMDKVLKAKDSLIKDRNFQTAIDPLLQPNNGYLYLDWLTSQPNLESQFPLLKLIELTGKPLFDHLKSLTISSYGNQSGVQRGGAFIKLTN